MEFFKKIRTSSALLIAAMALSQFPAAAFADCTSIYRSDIQRIAAKDYLYGAGIGHNDEAKPKWGLSTAIALVAPLGVTGLLTTVDAIRIADRQKTIDLLSAARAGDGLPLARLADGFETTVERVVEVILELNSKKIFCIDYKVLSYGEVYELISLKLKAQK